MFIVSVINLVGIKIFINFVQLDEKKLYRIARKKHGNLNQDVVHDLFLKFGNDLPDVKYLSTCIKHAKPQPLQQQFDLGEQAHDREPEESINRYALLIKAMANIEFKYPIEVDTFLACMVNGTVKEFENKSGIARSVLEKICKFVKYEILDEYNRLAALDRT